MSLEIQFLVLDRHTYINIYKRWGKTEGQIKNEQSRDTDNIEHIKHKTKTSKAKPKTQHNKAD